MVKATSKPALRLPTQGSSSFYMKEEGREFRGRRRGFQKNRRTRDSGEVKRTSL